MPKLSLVQRIRRHLANMDSVGVTHLGFLGEAVDHAKACGDVTGLQVLIGEGPAKLRGDMATILRQVMPCKASKADDQPGGIAIKIDKSINTDEERRKPFDAKLAKLKAFVSNGKSIYSDEVGAEFLGKTKAAPKTFEERLMSAACAEGKDHDIEDVAKSLRRVAAMLERQAKLHDTKAKALAAAKEAIKPKPKASTEAAKATEAAKPKAVRKAKPKAAAA